MFMLILQASFFTRNVASRGIKCYLCDELTKITKVEAQFQVIISEKLNLYYFPSKEILERKIVNSMTRRLFGVAEEMVACRIHLWCGAAVKNPAGNKFDSLYRSDFLH